MTYENRIALISFSLPSIRVDRTEHTHPGGTSDRKLLFNEIDSRCVDIMLGVIVNSCSFLVKSRLFQSLCLNFIAKIQTYPFLVFDCVYGW